MKEEKAFVYSIKNIHFDEESSILYSILSDYAYNKNYILESMINFLDEVEDGNNSIKYLNKKFSKDSYLFEILLDYACNNNLITIKDNDCSLNCDGKLFILSDSITNTVDMIRYFWNKLSWNDICPQIGTSPFLSKDSRRYFACLLSQIDLIPYSMETIKNKYQNIDMSYFKNYRIIESMLNDNYASFILYHIFCPMGLVSFSCTGGKTNNIILTDAGRKIFDYYSFNMVEEYRVMIDESWEYFDKGNFEQAYDIAKSAIGVIGNVPEIYNIIGCINIKEKKFDAARDTFLFALELCEENIIKNCRDKKSMMDTYVIIYYNLGLCYYYEEEYIKALHIFRNIKKTAPYYLDSIDNIIAMVKKNIII